jgi:DNA-binding Lrp family transcriptional regulator
MEKIYIISSGQELWYEPRGLVLPWGVEKHLDPESLFILIRLLNAATPHRVEITEAQLAEIVGLPTSRILKAVDEFKAAGVVRTTAFSVNPMIIEFRSRPRGYRYGGGPSRRLTRYLEQMTRKYKPKPYRESYVYFMFSKATQWVKIGMSLAPEQRRVELQQQLGEVLEILATVPYTSHGKGLERELHLRFNKYCVKHPKHASKREWFVLSDEILQYIKEHEGRPDLESN